MDDCFFIIYNCKFISLVNGKIFELNFIFVFEGVLYVYVVIVFEVSVYG